MSFSPKLVSRQNATYPLCHEKAFGFVREGIGSLNFLSPLSTMEIVFKIFPKLVSRQNATYPLRQRKGFRNCRGRDKLAKGLSPISAMEIIIENFALFEQILASTTLGIKPLSLTNPPNHVKVFAHWAVLIYFG